MPVCQSCAQPLSAWTAEPSLCWPRATGRLADLCRARWPGCEPPLLYALDLPRPACMEWALTALCHKNDRDESRWPLPRSTWLAAIGVFVDVPPARGEGLLAACYGAPARAIQRSAWKTSRRSCWRWGGGCSSSSVKYLQYIL